MEIKKLIFSPWPYFGKEEIDAVTSVLSSGKVNQWTGQEIYSFEKEYADYLGIKHAIALANGSVALDLALQVLNIGPGDEVIVTPRTFVASSHCIVLKGATPVFADVDPDSQNITVESVQKVFTPKTKAIIAVHLGGWPCELKALRDFCNAHKLFLIEDCAQAHGSKYANLPAGSVGHIATFSFCQDKILTTGGEGGLLATNDSDLWAKAWSFKDHGKDYQTIFHEKHQGFIWAIKNFGTNYRMTEMQAAIGRIVLRKLDAWVTKRRQFAYILTEGFSNIPALRLTLPPENIYHSYYKYYAFIRPEKLKSGWTRGRILESLQQKGIPCSAGSCSEVYLEEAYQKAAYQKSRLAVAKQLGETALMFLVHPTLDDSHMHYIVENMRIVMTEAS